MENYQLLDQFRGMKCSVGFHSITDTNILTSYIYQSFAYYLDEDGFIFLEDKINDKEAFTYFELSKVNEIKNLNDSIYHDVVSFYTDEYIIDVCTLESKPVLPKCHKCGKDILIPESVNWRVVGHSCYENPYDNDMDIIDSLNFCSDCIVGFIGSIENYSCVGEYTFS